VAQPEAFKTELPLIQNHPYFKSVAVERDIDVAIAAKLANVSLEDFKALNPAMNRPVILAAGTPQILLPWDNATVFKRNFEGYTAGQYASWTAWTAPATMTVAEAARRVGMGESEFRGLNGIPPRMMIRAGSVVLVPRSAKVIDDVSSRVADFAQLSLSPEVSIRRSTVKAGKHDTVASLAARYKLRAADVAHWNDVALSARFKPGQKVVVELPVRAHATRTATARAKPAGAAGPVAKAGRAKAPARSAKAPANARVATSR
jgi:membrane-bound lytic murein transglycosylase D